MKTAVFSAKPFEIDSFKKANQNSSHQLSYFTEQLNTDTAGLAKGYEAISVFSNDVVSAQVLDLLHTYGIGFITLRSAGYDHVDLAYAKKLGIKIANVPDYSPYSIAEHSVMLMMSLNRKLLLADKRVRKYDFSLDPLVGFDMNGKVVGLIGTGKIGGVVAKILHGFGCTLLGYDPYPDKELTEKFNLSYVSLQEIIKQSDIISIHCPLNEHTRYMIDAQAISTMKKGVMLINTSRGAIIKTDDLIPALESNQIGYLGLDVYEHEKGLFFNDHSHSGNRDKLLDRLLEFENVLVTGHQAFLTKTALQNRAESTIFNLDNFERKVKGKNELI
ncbi:MAG: 2-hydroxyacid dehydrogenase [Cytophagaceae bacterium]